MIRTFLRLFKAPVPSERIIDSLPHTLTSFDDWKSQVLPQLLARQQFPNHRHDLGTISRLELGEKYPRMNFDKNEYEEWEFAGVVRVFQNGRMNFMFVRDRRVTYEVPHVTAGMVEKKEEFKDQLLDIKVG